MATSKGPRPKHIPARTCIACKQTRGKREMVRVVRTPMGQVEVDPIGKKSGRGAYICRTKQCWEQAFRRKALEHALQTQISLENRLALESYAESLPEGS